MCICRCHAYLSRTAKGTCVYLRSDVIDVVIVMNYVMLRQKFAVIIIIVIVSIQFSRIRNIQCAYHVIVFHFQRQCLCKAQTAAVSEYY